ncbi:alpha/beta hydrolase [Mycolicibacterium sp. 018/SC-01/001]|uniref:alpha/beta hydrolase n=1 Tax=Mycolicibacterium sp. 018/SC-01/001 TaxID=2592069 RepID=UPI001C8F44AA|nr:alpha/beta hydrolase [Mycolicibacterium sp. 018/SC-01/001]
MNRSNSDVTAGEPPALVSRTFGTSRHTTHYLESGPADGPLMVFLHGWPSIGLMWRAQVEAFARDGWRCVAPDLRGYGGSSSPADTDAYTIESIVTDMTELHDHLGGAPAIWVGHDWGSVVAADLTAHEPALSRGLVLTSLAYLPDGHALPTLIPLVDREIYPADEYPDGQWDYYRYYTEHFTSAVADLDADLVSSLASIFQPGDPAGVGKVSPNALVTRNGGRFGTAHRAPLTRPDPSIWPPDDFDVLVQTFAERGFRPGCAWYLNDDAALAYARTAPDGGRLSQPVLFVNGEFDQICTITGNRLGEPMREACDNLTVVGVSAGHWLPLERSGDHIDSIRNWLRAEHL